MSYQVGTCPEKLMDMTSNDFSHNIHLRSQENTFRWAHNENLDKNSIACKLPYPEKNDGRYNDVSRYEDFRIKHEAPHENDEEQTFSDRNSSLHSPQVTNHSHENRFSPISPSQKRKWCNGSDDSKLQPYGEQYETHGQADDESSRPQRNGHANGIYSSKTEQGKEDDRNSSVSFRVSAKQSKEDLLKNNFKFEKEENHNENLKLDVQSMMEIKESSNEIMEKIDVPKLFSKDTVEKNDKRSDPKVKNSENSEKENSENSKKETVNQNNDLPSYTAMIAQAILKTDSSKSTLADIYEYMEKHFPSLEKRGTGWRNCVRHTLSLNDCFIKLHRPENGRSCNWAIHPSYYETFSRGDYRKRRALRKRPRGLQWGDPFMMCSYGFGREHEIHPDYAHQQSGLHPFHSHPGLWNSAYSNPISPVPPSSSHLQHFPQNQINPLYPGSHSSHLHGHHCTSPDCYCQYSKNNYRPYAS